MKRFFFLALITALIAACGTQQQSANNEGAADFSTNDIQVMFYNVENLFDTVNSPGIRDGEFTPSGSKHWTYWRYREKLEHISKVVMNTQSWQPPAIIGLCEVENRQVLEDLINETALVKYGYNIIHQESPDERGIDVALLYRRDYVNMIGSKTYEVRFPYDTADHTRDILLSTGVIGNDTVHFFVNHWPSRYGGMEKSQPDRIEAAKTLRGVVDSLFAVSPNKKIIIMGDFNDGPDNKSISEVLNAKGYLDSLNATADLYDFMAPMKRQGLGSYRYRGEWNTLDQFIVSSAVLLGNKFTAMPEGARIMKDEFLLEEDPYNPGSAPFRTYVGPRYLGGYSDHLPIVLTLSYKAP